MMWVFFLLLLVLAGVLQLKMGAYALKCVSVALEVDSLLADPGEQTALTIRVENHGKLPILYLKIAVSLPRETESLTGEIKISEIYQLKKYVFSCYLLPGRRLERRVKISFPKRGVWHLGGVQLEAGDLLGIRENTESRNVTAMLVTAPPPIKGLVLQQIAGGMMGDLSVRRWIHEDPILSAGYHEYTGREPQRSIAWARSLASGRMMVRNYDHTTDQRVRILLLIEADEEIGRMEAAFSMVRTLCDQLEQESVPYSFASNGELFSFLGRMERVENGLGNNHRNRILDSLGRAGYGARYDMEKMIQKEIRFSDPVQGYLLVVTAYTQRIRSLKECLEGFTNAHVLVLEAPQNDTAKEKEVC